MIPSKIIKSGQAVKYSFNENFFEIDSPINIDPHFKQTLKNISVIKKATQDIEEIVEIYSISEYFDQKKVSRAKARTEFLSDYYPMILMKSNYNLYCDAEVDLIKNNFKNILSENVETLQEYYDSIVSTYQSFINATGFYFFDMSSNNIMVHTNKFKFKIIDIFSIKKVDFDEKEINPLSILFYHNIVKHSNLDYKSLRKKCLTFFNFIEDLIDVNKSIEKISLIKPKKIFKKEI